MDVWEAIEKRKTVRVFKGNVPEAMVRKLILAGSRAPSGNNSQPWEFIVVRDPASIAAIAEQKYLMGVELQKTSEEAALLQKNAYRNTSVVAVCNKKSGLSSVAAWMAAQNMALAATAEGFACVMSTFAGEYRERVQDVLGIPDTHELATVMVLGVPERMPEKREIGVDRPDFSWLHLDKFGNPG